jgi:hypothetical protein
MPTKHEHVHSPARAHHSHTTRQALGIVTAKRPPSLLFIRHSPLPTTLYTRSLFYQARWATARLVSDKAKPRGIPTVPKQLLRAHS